ncbi:MAG: 3-dehydroquinate synthase, partial [Acidiferrobacterales bacterium]
MKILDLDLGDRSYPIIIGTNHYADAEILGKYITGKRVVIISNETVAPIYLEKLATSLESYDPVSIILPDGEKYKILNTIDVIIDQLLAARCDRKITLIALGGGVIGDMTGFAAACYMRGVAFIQIPTTLLAQVDSSVGGKTGVNHKRGKNMIGAFYQPKCVLIDTATLDTLPGKELSAGLAEVIKYGLIRDKNFLFWLEENMTRLLARDPAALSHAIFESCRHKAEVVAADELEQGGRALLNLGHTFGHAIEAGMGYGNWLHGEAIAAGMVMAAELSCRLGWLARADVVRVEKIISMAKLPIR